MLSRCQQWHGYNINVFSSVIADKFSLIMITDRPAAASESTANSVLKLSCVSSIKSPVLEFIQQVISYKDIIPRDEFRAKPY